MKNITKIFVAISFMWLAVACHQEDIYLEPNNLTSSEVGVFGNEMHLSLGIDAPDPVEVVTRGVDPDGKALRSLTVFCFDRNGLLISTSTANVVPKQGSEDNTEGKITVSVPIATRIMHLVGNQNMSRFDRNTFTNKSEDEVLSILEGSAGMLIYWARIEVPTNVNSLYQDAQYELSNGATGTAERAHRTEPEAIVDWLTIETNPSNAIHRGIEGKGNPIIFLRNQARFSIVSEGLEENGDEWKGKFFEVTGFAICNSPAFGTVAPYHSDYGFPTYAYTDFIPYYGVVSGTKSNWLSDENSVTLPARRDMLTNVTDVSNARDQFIFETNNESTQPVDLILKGYNMIEKEGPNGTKVYEREQNERYYYRINIMDQESGDMIPIRRNHHYIVHIEDHLTNGCETFEEALRSPATNNIWLSISDEVKAVRDNEVELSVATTKLVMDANVLEEDFFARMQPFQFNVNKLSEDVVLNEDKLTVRWIENDQRVSTTHNPNLVIGDAVAFDTATGEGLITIQLNELPEGEEEVRGTLLVKYGRLQRKIRVVIVRQQSFVPAWVSSEVYGKLTNDTYEGENVTVMFNIPETCPKELFPMKVLVTTNGLDGRAASGQVLPIVKKGDAGYGEEFSIAVKGSDGKTVVLTDLGYKYEYTVNEPGQHRLYFRNIFEVEKGGVEYVVLQADHFETIAKPVTFVEHQNKILMPMLKGHTATDDGDVIQYILVPQKRFAPVTFDIALEVTDGTPFVTLTNEEFLLYSSNIDHYPDDDSRISTTTKDTFDCIFQPYDASQWGTGGRIFGFYPRTKSNGFWESKIGTDGEQHDVFQIFLETNKPKSAEVVRIASNQNGSPSVINASDEYNGMTFRSVTFELANYRPFRFAAQIRSQESLPYEWKGNYKVDASNNSSSDTEPEDIEDISFTYLPDQVVELSFDITSFEASDGTSVDPFGTGFEIFIDAPMLYLEKGMNKCMFGDNFEDLKVNMFDKKEDGTHVNDPKEKLKDLGNGRFVYRVDAYPSTEADYWANISGTSTVASSALPLIVDNAAAVVPYGDRKTIRFRKKSVVSDGQIVISANPEHVTYHSKTFNVNNTPIKGIIGYIDENENRQVVPAGQFVSFSRVLDDSRVGSLVVVPNTDGGPVQTKFELRLRGEYDFRWTDDPIKIQTQVDGKLYSTVISGIDQLYTNDGSAQIILELVE